MTKVSISDLLWMFFILAALQPVIHKQLLDAMAQTQERRDREEADADQRREGMGLRISVEIACR